jgi:hypothetical protein
MSWRRPGSLGFCSPFCLVKAAEGIFSQAIFASRCSFEKCVDVNDVSKKGLCPNCLLLLHKRLRTVAITATFIYGEHWSASGSMHRLEGRTLDLKLTALHLVFCKQRLTHATSSAISKPRPTTGYQQMYTLLRELLTVFDKIPGLRSGFNARSWG